MFLGHFAVGLAARPLAPRVPLPVLLAAPQALDLVWPVLVGAGVEHAHLEPGHLAASPLVLEDMPYSHSLVAAIGWALVCAIGYGVIARERRGAIVIALLVVSHWLLDLVAHEPDLQLIPGGARYGLGLWRSLPATLATELTMFAIGGWLYTRSTVATGARGRWGWPILAAVLVIAFLLAALSPPPPSIDTVIVMAGVMIAAIIGAAAAIDRQRPARTPAR